MLQWPLTKSCLCCAGVSQVMQWAKDSLGVQLVMPSDIQIFNIPSIPGLWVHWDMDRVEQALGAFAAFTACKAPRVSSRLSEVRERLAAAFAASGLYQGEYTERKCAASARPVHPVFHTKLLRQVRMLSCVPAGICLGRSRCCACMYPFCNLWSPITKWVLAHAC